MFHTVKLSLFALVTLLFISCGGPKQSTMPNPHVNDKLDPTPSTVTLPITLTSEWLSAQINSATTGVLFQDDSVTVIAGFSRASVTVHKTEPIGVKISGSSFSYQLPLKLKLKLYTTVLGKELVQEVSGAIKVHMNTTLAINPDWSIATKTVMEKYDWISAPEARVGPVLIPLKTVADLTLHGMKKSIGPSVDKMVRTHIDLKKLLQPLWTEMHKPLLLDKNHQVWLRLTPHAVVLTPWVAKQNGMATVFGLSSLAECFVGAKPAATEVAPLPKITASAMDTGFTLTIDADMPYTKAQATAREYLLGKSFPMGRKTVTVDTVWVNGDSGLIKVDVAISGDYKGTVSLVGRPQLDTLNRVFSVEDIAFDMKTRNVLLKSAKWLFNGVIERELKKSLTFDLKTQFTDLQGLINQQLKGYYPLQDIKISGSVTALSPRGLALTPTGIRVGAVATGKLSVQLHNAPGQ